MIERLLKRVFSNVYDQNTKKLSYTMHHLSTENVLLKLRYQGLENALLNEQKKSQRGKPLAFNLPAPEDGNVVLYSPKKAQQARDLQAEKEKAIQLTKASKEEEKLRRQQEKKEKQRLIEERKRIRASNRELRIQEVERKRRQKEEERLAKEADLQLQMDLKQVKGGKKDIIQPVPILLKRSLLH
jgi:hypothetical protein